MTSLFEREADLSAPLLAARLVREEILSAPVRPDQRESLASAMVSGNARGGTPVAAIAAAARLGGDGDAPQVGRELLAHLSELCGSAEPRSGPGAAFHGQAAPPPAGATELLRELLETVNSPLALESWAPPTRAFALHFLLRLVQPFACPAGALAHAAEVYLLASDGFRGDRMLLPEPDVVADTKRGRPDPDGFALARAHRLVERLGESRDLVREATARAVLLGWVGEREAGLSARQRSLLAYLADTNAPRGMSFRDYVDLHAGRRAPSLRSLQRDWQVLRERGWIEERGELFVLSGAPLAFERDS